jgi:Tfp pilus assembly protein PilV
MNRAIVVFVAGALSLSGLIAQAQTSAQAQMSVTKPTCAAGDIVVWENAKTKAYHLPGDKYYGNTKHGAYACRSAADTAGYHLAGAKSKAAPADDGSPEPMASDTPPAAHHHHHHANAGAAASPTPSPAAT